MSALFKKKTTESEKDLEARLVREVTKRGGMCIKNTAQFHAGMPDRTVLLPYHTIAFVELKSTGAEPRPLQTATLKQLYELGFNAWLIDSTPQLERFLVVMDNRLRRLKAKVEASTSEPSFDSLNKLADHFQK